MLSPKSGIIGRMPSYSNQVNLKSLCHPQAMRLKDQVSEVMCYHYYGHRTEEFYSHWTKGFLYFRNKKNSKDMGKAETEAYLRCPRTTPMFF